MDSVRDPALLLGALGASTGVGAIIYTYYNSESIYKELEAIKEDLRNNTHGNNSDLINQTINRLDRTIIDMKDQNVIYRKTIDNAISHIENNVITLANNFRNINYRLQQLEGNIRTHNAASCGQIPSGISSGSSSVVTPNTIAESSRNGTVLDLAPPQEPMQQTPQKIIEEARRNASSTT